MERKYNVTGERRKEMVEVVSGIVGMKAVYMRMPTCAYAISKFPVSKGGTLVWDERSSAELVEKVLAGLAQAGFTAEPEETAEAQEEPQDSAEAAAEETATDAPKTAEGEEAAESDSVVALAVAALPGGLGAYAVAFGIDLGAFEGYLARARLAGNLYGIVAQYFSGATLAPYHAVHHLAQGGGVFGAHHATAHIADLEHGVAAVGGAQTLDESRTHELAVVCHGIVERTGI